jgi:chromate transporter
MMLQVKELAALFLKLGTVAFGGPAAHIAMMEDEVVKRRKWLSHEHFLDLVGATNLIPGPNSTEMAIHIGYVKAGWRGLVVAGVCFIVPAVFISLVLAHLYVSYGSIPQLHPVIAGIRPAVIAIILAAVFRLSKPFMKNRSMIVVSLAVIVLSLLHCDEIMLLLGAGIVGLVWANRDQLLSSASRLFAVALLPTILISTPLVATHEAQTPATLTGLGLFFLKIGSILYGSGYVLIAFIQGGLVDVRHWLTQTQLLDAVAVGQFTPGPVLSTATFIGYLILGVPGAGVATMGIFLPSFIFVLFSSPFIPKLRKSRLASGFLDGVNAASLGLMLSVAITLAGTTLSGIGSWIIFLLAASITAIWNLNATWIVLGASVLGWMFSLTLM